MIKVLHIDDDRDHHELTKAQIGQLSDDINLEYSDSSQSALAALKDNVYDCILTDDQLPKNDGIELLKILRADGNLIPFVVISRLKYEKDGDFLEKAYAEDEFNAAVNYFHFDTLSYLIHRLVDKYKQHLQVEKSKLDLFQRSPEKIEELQEALATLTKRELEILNMIGSGRSNKEIAEKLSISYWTVKNHVYNLFTKLDIHTRAEAIHIALSMKIVDES